MILPLLVKVSKLCNLRCTYCYETPELGMCGATSEKLAAYGGCVYWVSNCPTATSATAGAIWRIGTAAGSTAASVISEASEPNDIAVDAKGLHWGSGGFTGKVKSLPFK